MKIGDQDQLLWVLSRTEKFTAAETWNAIQV